MTPLSQGDVVRVNRMYLCHEYGWTPEQVNNLDVQDYYDALGFLSAVNRKKSIEMDAAKARAKAKSRKR